MTGDPDYDYSRMGVNIGPQHLSLDPRTGEYVNRAGYDERDPISKPVVVTVKHADGSSTEVRIEGAKYRDLRDPDFVIAVATGDWDGWLIKQHRVVTKEEWNAYIVKLAAKHPEAVK